MILKKVFVQFIWTQIILLGVCSNSNALQVNVCGTLVVDAGRTWMHAPGGDRILLTTLDPWSYRDAPIRLAGIQEVLDSFGRLHGYRVCVWGDRVAGVLTVEYIQSVSPQPRQLAQPSHDVRLLDCPTFFVR